MQQAAAQIPWFHNCILLDKVKDEKERLWYARQTVESGWSRNVLEHQIETKLYERQGKAVTNFERTLPAPQDPDPGPDPDSDRFLSVDPVTSLLSGTCASLPPRLHLSFSAYVLFFIRPLLDRTGASSYLPEYCQARSPANVAER